MFRKFIQRTLDASKRATAWNLEDISPPKEALLFHFKNEQDLAHWTPYSDKPHGGRSTCAFSIADGSALLSGELSIEVEDEAMSRLKRSGFAGIRTIEGTYFPDMEPFNTVAMRVKGDGRVYLSSLRTDNWVGSPWGLENNTWQAFIFAPKGAWHTVKIPMNRYMLTWQGKVIEGDASMSAQSVQGMGISLSAEGSPTQSVSGDGPFNLQVEWIKCLRT